MKRPAVALLFLALAAHAAGAGQAPRLSTTTPAAPATAERAGEEVATIDVRRLDAIDPLVREAIAERKLPGAVVLVGRGDRVLYQRAFGNRAVVPQLEVMTPDTVFDVASLTKVVVTTTSVMMLLEQGKLRLSDRVATFIPGFERYGKGDITVRHLLTHVSGLRPDVDLADAWSGYETAIALAVEEVPTARPGEQFVYSDINFFLLGDIVQRISGLPLDRFARERIFEPLDMTDTMFLPPVALRPRIAPTESCTPFGWPCDGTDAQMLRGVVHDPTARRMGGVAGHAGLFSTAADLAVFCRMLLGGGVYEGTRILSPLTVAKMTSAATPDLERNTRAFGWDIDSSFSSNRGELLPIGSFGHTGFTGTSLWIDPATRLFVVFLSNRVHPDGTGDVTPLRARVATVAAAAITSAPVPDARQWTGRDFGPSGTLPPRSSTPVATGIEVLRGDGFALLKGRRVGLVTNHTGRARDGASTIDLLYRAPDVTLVSLFSPEHGIRGILDSRVPSAVDEKTGLTIHSLYGETQRPTSAMLQGIDTIVIDLQDIGARFYTYMTTMAYVMEEAAARGIAVVVLDRPNPINGFQIEGPMLDLAQLGFTGYLSMPIRHGLTLGELARLFNGENRIGANLTVVPARYWRRDDWFDETGLPWINPSPNMRNLIQATLYPGIGAFEGTNLSVGRGTDTPFEQIGAPWIDGVLLADTLNARGLAGIRFYPVRFTPSSSKYAGEECQGVFMIVADRLALRPVRVGVEIASAIQKLFGAKFELDSAERLFGSRDGLARIRAGEDPASIAASWAAGEARWRLLRNQYLLYR
ncbi:MAG TPA: exo-beta-N-acetylmuramidase NamZ domain-containing protein [Vicinamibacterales bacterium]|nr:exo-beta-N-acetylmuramidase NamZ domain-containing protein [Vicinamibacterales bacterium]